MGQIHVSPMSPADRSAWDELYQGYAAFYRVDQTTAMRDRVWGWLMDTGHETCGLIALDASGRAVGIAHFRAFARPLSASVGGYLDDLFVAPDARGRGVAAALIAAVQAHAAAQGWTVVRWITADDNTAAQALYDRLARRTAWVTYDLAP